jgi:2-polyprenyl-3-methyl-5-hydroxy-6-metoxy-1,4-benzoquinol methylase
MNKQTYIGSELELFSLAHTWKEYYSHLMQPYLGNNVLEVGAGIGTTTRSLCKGKQRTWTCLEPDPILADQIQKLINRNNLPQYCVARTGTLAELNPTEFYETIIYVDVLEHIQDDKVEVKLAAQHLRNGGNLIVLAPAHQQLFTPFDQAIGHYRRYNKTMLTNIIPQNLKCIRLNYIDSIGLIATLANRYILKSKMPSQKQILVWDKFLVPMSKVLDPIFQYSVGKSILGIWQKN